MNSEIVGSRHLSRANAKTIAAAVQRLQSSGLAITASTLLDISRPPRSPTHKLFEWDDTKAAEAHRLTQAAFYIREVAVVIQSSTKKAHRVRAYVSVVKNGSRQYSDIEEALSVPEQREQLLAMAYRDMEAFRKRYETLSELASVFSAIGRVVRRKKKAA